MSDGAITFVRLAIGNLAFPQSEIELNAERTPRLLPATSLKAVALKRVILLHGKRFPACLVTFVHPPTTTIYGMILPMLKRAIRRLVAPMILVCVLAGCSHAPQERTLSVSELIKADSDAASRGQQVQVTALVTYCDSDWKVLFLRRPGRLNVRQAACRGRGSVRRSCASFRNYAPISGSDSTMSPSRS